MLDRPPSDTDRKRELNRQAQRRRRERERERISTYPGRASPLLIEALIARSIDGGLSEPEAERASRNRKKVADDMDAIGDEWARRYLAERRKTRHA